MAAIFLRGFNERNVTTFVAERDGGQLRTQPAGQPLTQAARETVRLEFAAPTGDPPLFVLPVFHNTLSVKLESNGRKLDIEGRMRSLLPAELGQSLGEIAFAFELIPAGVADAIVAFDQFDLGQVRVDRRHLPLPLSVTALKAATANASLNGHYEPQAEWLKWTGLLYRPSVKRLPFVIAFVPVAASGHALLSLRLSADVPLHEAGAPDIRHFAPFGIDVRKQEWRRTVDASGVAVVRVCQHLPDAAQWAASGRTRHWWLTIDLPQRAVLRWWKRRVLAPVTEGLQILQDGRPLTTLPLLHESADVRDAWQAWFQVVDAGTPQKLAERDYHSGLPRTVPAASGLTIIPRHLTPAPGNRPLRAAFPGFGTIDGRPLRMRCQLLPAPPANVFDAPSVEPDDEPAVLLQFKPLAPGADREPQVARLGALDLTTPARPAPLTASTPWGELPEFDATMFGASRVGAILAYGDITRRFRVLGVAARRSQLQLPILSVQPGTQDDETGAEFLQTSAESEQEQDAETRRRLARTRPVVVTLGDTTPATAIAFRLATDETLEPDASQTIDVQLHARKRGVSTPLVALVLDDQPFTACVVDAGHLDDSELDKGTEIGNWSNRAGEGFWEIRAGTFELVLPPQGVGEAMHRSSGDRDVIPEEPIDFRFTPPARVTLRPSDTKQRFVEPGWNLRRLLKRRPPVSGAAVQRLRAELFYGLTASIEARGLRLTEIGARLGALAGPLRKSENRGPAYAAIRERWTQLLRGLRTRLGVYEVSSPVRDILAEENAVPTPLSLTAADGLGFALRPQARLAYPITGAEPKPVPDGRQDITVFDKEGLRGGWSWGFQSRNVLEAVRARPQSTSGQLTGLYLSAMGGWASQKASFDNDRTTIYTTVDMGRTSSINIERIGRIGVFWNRAKHVIVYERTVAPSRQFYLEQESLLGNPVLRKVDEYIELIEEERGYPDRDMPPTTRAFVVGSRFGNGKAPRIRVNSAWGQEVGDLGWKIPLWHRGAVPADVYPKPSVCVLAAGLNAKDRVPIGIDDPEKLWFFTSTRPDLTSDTDAWPAVEGVDFQPVSDDTGNGRADLSAPPAPANTGGDPKNFNTPDRLITAPLEAFSFSLEPAPAPVNLVADRTAEVIRALPRSVTMMRGIAVGGPAPTEVSDVRTLRAAVRNAFAPVLQPDGRKSPAEIKAEFATQMAATTRAAHALLGRPEMAASLCDAMASRVTRQFDVFAAETRLHVVSALHQVHARIDAEIEAAFASGDAEAAREWLAGTLTDAIEGAEGARQAVTTARGMVGEMFAKLESAEAAISQAGAQVVAMVSAAAADLADDWDPDVARKRLERLATQWERYVLPGPVDFAIGDAVRSWLGQGVNKVAAQLSLLRPRLVERLNTLLKGSLSSQDDTITELLAIADAAVVTFADVLELLRTEWTQQIEPLLETRLAAPLDELRETLEQVLASLDETDPNVFRRRLQENVAAYFDGLDERLDALMPAVRDEVGARARQLCSALQPSIGDLKAIVGQVLDPNALDFLAGPITPELRQQVEEVLARVSAGVTAVCERARQALPALQVNPSELADPVVRLLRAFGDVPRVPNLEFHLPQVGYYFYKPDGSLPLPAIDLSPVAAYANRLGREVLNAIDVTVPARQLLDRLVPPALENFDLSKLFPNFAGLRLDSLLRGVRAPRGGGEGVRITHGVDEAARTAWLHASVDVTLTSDAPLFEIAGTRLTLRRATFRGYSKIEAALNEPPRQRSAGSIHGDWLLEAGGMPIADLTASTLRFDEEGRIHFDISPAQVKLRPPLDFISRLLEPFNSSKDGFSVAVTPTAVRTSLMLPMPNLQGGTFGIAHLSLGFLFELVFVPDFVIRTALLLSRPEKPFTLTVFILGGAGAMRFAVAYRPASGLFTTEFSCELYASASLAISLGPISGGIYAYLGVAVTYTASSAGASSLYFGIRILFIGEVSVLGIISVNITLGLEAGYRGNQLIGTGFVSLSIKVGWFLTITVDASVTYEFGTGQSTSQSQAQVESAADDYLAMF